ncbi:MAG: S8 family serine peptidase [Opitutales bacterium]|nr:S8 family serine peptidase [Opitutales bacterium]
MFLIRKVFPLALLLSAFLAFWLAKNFSFQGNHLKQISLKNKQPHQAPLPNFNAGGEVVPFEYSLLEEINQTSVKEFDDLLKQLNAGNDWVLCLDEASLENLAVNASISGIKLVESLPELGVIRVKILDTKKALPLLIEYISNNQISPNYTMRQPLPPRKELVLDEASFSDSYIKWLGGRDDRANLGTGVKVALLDSGVDLSHPMLAGASIKQTNLLTNNGIAGVGHGTALASVMVGTTSGNQGIAPRSEILSYRVIDKTGKADSYTVASGIVKAVQDGARVINLSLGAEYGSDVLKHAVGYARENGVSIVAAVGNDGEGLVNFPAAYDGVIGVSSVGKNGQVSSFSNYGKGVDIAAPGVGVLAAWELQERVSFSGTSVSTAIVSASIAAELSNDPNLTSHDAEDLLLRHANESGRPGFDLIAGHGILSLGRLENRTNEYYSDPALVGYYFGESGVISGTVPFEVIIQNQGNTLLNNLNLEVEYLGSVNKFRVNNLAPAEIRSEKLYLQGSDVDGFLKIDSRLIISSGTKDDRPENNFRKSTIRF